MYSIRRKKCKSFNIIKNTIEICTMGHSEDEKIIFLKKVKKKLTFAPSKIWNLYQGVV